jgi:hypothetical protein
METTTSKAYGIPRIMSSVSPLEPYNRHQDIRHKLITSDECRDRVGMTTVAGVTPKDQLHFMVPSPRNEDFIGESNIASWFKAFHKRRTEAGKSQHTGHLRLALCGLGGIGYVLETKNYLRSQLIPNRKTQDVLSFIYQYENRRPVFWIHSGNVIQFEGDCRKLGSLAKIPGHDDTKQNIGFIVKQWLESPQSGEWILVIDNGDNKLDFYPEPRSTQGEPKESDNAAIAHDGIAKCIPRCSKGTVIITTGDREVAKYLANQNVIIKSELSPEQVVELFYQYCSNTESTPDDTPGDATPDNTTPDDPLLYRSFC